MNARKDERSAIDSGRIERFCKTTRWFHWTFALSFLALAGTGVVLLLREQLTIQPETADALTEAHKVAAIVFLTAPWLVVASGDTRSWLADIALLVQFRRDDLTWLRMQLRPWDHEGLPPQGKLNAGQKVNGLMVFALASVLTVTGVVLWREPGAFAALVLHIAAFAFWVPAFCGHLFLALVNPTTRPALRGMVRGTIRREWGREHHRLWVDSLERE